MKISQQGILWMSVAAVLATLPVQASEPGSAGALFLRVGMGARASGMGEAFTAVAEDASSIYWNPAAMSPLLGTNVMLAHNEYFQSVRVEQAALTHEAEWGTVGLSFTGLYMDDLERREDIPSAIPLGEFSVYDIAFAVAYSRYITPNLTMGISIKPIIQRIDEVDATGVAFDLGIFHVSRIKGVNFAAVLGNLGSPMKFDQEEFALPRFVKVGASYHRDVAGIRGGVLGALDIVFPNDGDPHTHVGLEADYERRFFLRGGYKVGYDSQGATFGLGGTYRRFSLDYAFMLVDNDLGDGHRISLALSL